MLFDLSGSIFDASYGWGPSDRRVWSVLELAGIRIIGHSDDGQIIGQSEKSEHAAQSNGQAASSQPNSTASQNRSRTASIPDAVTRLVAACRNSEGKNKEIEEIIACDPSLSVRVLRLANSPLFCPARDITSIAHAVALLGRRRLKSISMSVAAANMLLSGNGAGIQRRRLWNHSLGCASVATCLAAHVSGVEADDAFLAGVFHDVGKLLFLDVIAEEYEELASSICGCSLIEEEHFLFGTTHEEIGARSANCWGLANEILAPIGWHHRPHEAPFCQAHALVISVADRLARIWAIGSKADTETEANLDFVDELGVTADQLNSVEHDARWAFEQIMHAST